VRCALKRQLRLIEKTSRPAAGLVGEGSASSSGNKDRPANAADPAFTKSLRFMFFSVLDLRSGTVFQNRGAIARLTRITQMCTDLHQLL